jgi:hypothetical protein
MPFDISMCTARDAFPLGLYLGGLAITHRHALPSCGPAYSQGALFTVCHALRATELGPGRGGGAEVAEARPVLPAAALLLPAAACWLLVAAYWGSGCLATWLAGL